MAANFIQLPVDSSGKKVQTWDNSLGGNDVHTEASVSTDINGVPVGTAANPDFNSLTDGTNGPVAVKPASTAALSTDKALVVTEPGSTTASSPANTAVTSAASNLLSANPARREVIITNTDVVVIYIALGQTPTSSAYHVALSPCQVAHDGTGGIFLSDIFKGQINAIVASTSGHASIVELT